MTNDNKDSSLTVWQSIEVLTKAILRMQKELSLMKNTTSDQKITLERGAELLPSSIYEAKIMLNNEFSIATLPKIGYRMFNGELIIRNHITKEEVKIPKDFHYLKVVKFNYDNYKLAFCNILGNEFFEYKKYDPQYSNISNEYKFVDLSSIKKIYNPHFKEYFSHAPSFLVAEGSIEPESPNYSVDLFKLTQDGKGRKIGTFIDEFGYFDNEDNLNYCNYHKNAGSDTCYFGKLDIKMVNMEVDENSKFHLITGNDSIILHPILENLDIF